MLMAEVVISEVLCFVCHNYRRTDKTTLLDTIAKFYHDDELYAAKTELNNYVSSLSAPPLVDGWSKLVNKQGLPIVRKSSDATMKRYADAEDLLQMFAVLDVQQVQLPKFVAADPDRLPGASACSPLICPTDSTAKLNATVEELLKRFDIMERKLQAPSMPAPAPAVPLPAAVVATDEPGALSTALRHNPQLLPTHLLLARSLWYGAAGLPKLRSWQARACS